MKLVTWNIQWGRGADGRVDLDRIVADARRLADFDVLCLQEVSAGYAAAELPGCDGSDQFEALAVRLPGFTPITGVATDVPRAGAGRRRFGNMILSRLPVLQVFRHLLPWPADPKEGSLPLGGTARSANGAPMSMQRVAVEANIETANGLVRVTTTHLAYYSTLQRSAQIERLRELHAEAVAQARCARPGDASNGPFEALPRGAAAVLVGDCNFRPDAPERLRLLEPIDAATPPYRDAWEIVYPGRPHEPTVGVHDKAQWPEPPFTFDFVFVSDDLVPRVRELRVDAASAASDHQPMLLELD